MARLDVDSFNKEKLVFLMAAGLFAGCVYKFIVSSPAELTVGRPLTVEEMPPPMVVPKADYIDNPEYFVIDGKKTGLYNVYSKELVNRERKTPFSPTFWLMAKPPVDETDVAVNPINNIKNIFRNQAAPVPPPPPPPPAIKKQDPVDDKGKTYTGSDWLSKVEFMGVVVMPDGKTYGMLKNKDSGKNIKVQTGDKIGDLKYTVVDVNRQEIEVRDDDGHFCTVKNIAGQKALPPDSPEVAVKDGEDGEAPDPKPKPNPAKTDAGHKAPPKKPGAGGPPKHGGKGGEKPADKPAPTAGKPGGGRPAGRSAAPQNTQAAADNAATDNNLPAGFEPPEDLQPQNVKLDADGLTPEEAAVKLLPTDNIELIRPAPGKMLTMREQQENQRRINAAVADWEKTHPDEVKKGASGPPSNTVHKR